MVKFTDESGSEMRRNVSVRNTRWINGIAIVLVKEKLIEA
jgi:hypothetical protein